MAFAAAAVCTLPTSRPLRLHNNRSAAITSTVRLGRRRPITCYAVLSRDDSASVPVSAIGPVNGDKSIFKLTLDLSDAPELAASYTTPGQSVVASVPSSGLRGAYIEVASAPHSGLQFDLLVRSVPNTTAERLCELAVGDLVDLGAATGKGLPVKDIQDAKTLLYFAVAEGLSPIRALIRGGYTNNLVFYYGARNKESVPLQDEINEWQKSGVDVKTVLLEPVQYPFLRDPKIEDPESTVAVLVGPIEMQQQVKKALTGLGVPAGKIATVAQWYPNY